jgi:hypothetical protein
VEVLETSDLLQNASGALEGRGRFLLSVKGLTLSTRTSTGGRERERENQF